MKYIIPLETAKAASHLAGAMSVYLRVGDCLLLSGPVGAGKTHFARAILHAMMARGGVTEDVPSPTFTLVQTYETIEGEVWHADLYRLTHSDELIELGLEEAFDNAITLVEWPDRLGDFRPARHLDLRFSMPDLESDTRLLEITSSGPNWTWLENIAK